MVSDALSINSDSLKSCISDNLPSIISFVSLLSNDQVRISRTWLGEFVPQGIIDSYNSKLKSVLNFHLSSFSHAGQNGNTSVHGLWSAFSSTFWITQSNWVSSSSLETWSDLFFEQDRKMAARIRIK